MKRNKQKELKKTGAAFSKHRLPQRNNDPLGRFAGEDIKGLEPNTGLQFTFGSRGVNFSVSRSFVNKGKARHEKSLALLRKGSVRRQIYKRENENGTKNEIYKYILGEEDIEGAHNHNESCNCSLFCDIQQLYHS